MKQAIVVEDNEQKLVLGFYPYTYVRIVTMKSKLFKKSDYEKMLKQGFVELAKFLEESDYKREINEVTQQYPEIGFDLLETALNRNMIRTVQKLKSISPYALQQLIDAYAMRYDYYNIKTIIRGKHAQLSTAEIERLLLPLGTLTLKELQECILQETTEKVLIKSTLFRKQHHKFQQALQHMNEQQSLALLEQVIDQSYYERVLAFSQRIPEQGKLFRNFLEYEIDIINIKTLLRLKQQHVSEQKIRSHLFLVGKLFSFAKFESFLRKDIAAIGKELGQTVLHKTFKNMQNKPETDDMIAVELMLDHYLLKKATLLLHQYPLSIDTLLGYLFAKEIEIRNLRTIIKGKQLHVNVEFIEQQLIIA